ncbi:MAG: hypothetical protein ABIH46_10460 [Chloroflexota bacterium]
MAEIKTFSKTLDALEGWRQFKRITKDAVAKDVTIHWPSGCNALVSVKVYHGPKQFCPRQGSLALDDATPTYRDLNERLTANEELWVEIQNGDSANPHSITVTVTIDGEGVED